MQFSSSKQRKYKRCRERGSHVRCVYATQDISRMGRTIVKEEDAENTNNSKIVKNLENMKIRRRKIANNT